MSQTDDKCLYKNALQILYGKTCFFTMRDKDGKMYGPSFEEKQIERAGPKFLDGESPLKERNSLWLEGRCIYCNTNDLGQGYTEGDHIVARNETLDADLNCYVVPCCKTCNSSKGKKDIFEWWIIHKKHNFTELGNVGGNYNEEEKLERLRSITGIFVRAEWKWRKEKANGNFLDEPISSGFKKAIEDLQEKIDDRQNH